MPINEKFLAARLQEQRNRLLTHLALPPVFRLPLLNGRMVAVQLVHYTERHRMELIAANNPLVAGLPGDAASLFQVLWRLHPLFYRRGDDTFPNRRGPATWLTCLRSWLAHRALVRAVRGAAVMMASVALAARLADSDQDEPATDAATSESSPLTSARPLANQWDDLADYYARQWHMDPSTLWDRPRALLWQLHRNRLLAEPEGELEVIDPSDALLA